MKYMFLLLIIIPHCAAAHMTEYSKLVSPLGYELTHVASNEFGNEPIDRQTSIYSNFGAPSIIASSNLPVTISSPGRYILVESGNFAPSGSGAAITINSSNVTLDLLSFNLAQLNGIASVNGVVVNSGFTNVVIQNGVIRDFSNVGISISSGCSRVTLNNLIFYDCGNRCLELVGSYASPIQVGSLTNCTFLYSSTLTTADNVLTLSNCYDFEIDHCNLHNNGSTSASGALAIVNVSNSWRCQFTNNDTNNNLGNSDLRCYDLKQSCYCTFKHCNATTNLAWGATSAAYGFLLEGNNTSTANIFTECTVNNLTGTTVDGFLSSSNCDDNTFLACKSFANKANATTGVAHGFRCINNNRNQFIGCIASHNTAPSSTVAAPLYSAYGFKIDSTTGTYLHQCIANDQTASSRAVGFFLIACNLCTVNDNSANRNTTFGFDAANLNFNNQAFIKNFGLKNNIAGGSGSNQFNGFGANAANDGFTATNFGANTGGLTGQPGPVSWINLGIG